MSNFWIGPYNIRVDNSVDRVVASDGGNTCLKSGGQTEMGVRGHLSKEEYLKRYTELRADGHYWWK